MGSALRLVRDRDISTTCDDVVANRARFERLEDALKKLPQVDNSDLSLKEYISGGMYCREITIPKGTLITGRIYKFDHIEIMIRGRIDILSADGGLKHYDGYNVIEALAGKRQAGYAYEDTVWLTVNRVPNIDTELMLAHTSVVTHEEYEAFHRAVNTTDYLRFLSEIGMTQDQMDSIVKTDDLVAMPDVYSSVYVSDSQLEGEGLYSHQFYARGDVICPARIGNHRTIAGRYTNHAFHPNAEIRKVDGEFYLFANRPIPAGAEILVNYRDVLEYRHSRGDL